MTCDHGWVAPVLSFSGKVLKKYLGLSSGPKRRAPGSNKRDGKSGRAEKAASLVCLGAVTMPRPATAVHSSAHSESSTYSRSMLCFSNLAQAPLKSELQGISRQWLHFPEAPARASQKSGSPTRVETGTGQSNVQSDAPAVNLGTGWVRADRDGQQQTAPQNSAEERDMRRFSVRGTMVHPYKGCLRTTGRKSIESRKKTKGLYYSVPTPQAQAQATYCIGSQQHFYLYFYLFFIVITPHTRLLVISLHLHLSRPFSLISLLDQSHSISQRQLPWASIAIADFAWLALAICEKKKPPSFAVKAHIHHHIRHWPFSAVPSSTYLPQGTYRPTYLTLTKGSLIASRICFISSSFFLTMSARLPYSTFLDIIWPLPCCRSFLPKTLGPSLALALAPALPSFAPSSLPITSMPSIAPTTDRQTFFHLFLKQEPHPPHPLQTLRVDSVLQLRHFDLTPTPLLVNITSTFGLSLSLISKREKEEKTRKSLTVVLPPNRPTNYSDSSAGTKNHAVQDIARTTHSASSTCFRFKMAVAGPCAHSFKMIKSDSTLIQWTCNLCHSGPHWSAAFVGAVTEHPRRPTAGKMVLTVRGRKMEACRQRGGLALDALELLLMTQTPFRHHPDTNVSPYPIPDLIALSCFITYEVSRWKYPSVDNAARQLQTGPLLRPSDAAGLYWFIPTAMHHQTRNTTRMSLRNALAIDDSQDFFGSDNIGFLFAGFSPFDSFTFGGGRRHEKSHATLSDQVRPPCRRGRVLGLNSGLAQWGRISVLHGARGTLWLRHLCSWPQLNAEPLCDDALEFPYLAEDGNDATAPFPVTIWNHQALSLNRQGGIIHPQLVRSPTLRPVSSLIRPQEDAPIARLHFISRF
ncbi:uncharacterized protein CLUP02_15225 [Colletotrichum lupini]|uniref:Uncharacterized protein n=1 Tax=Colletotrichum lupini TaxID=145971 RepID=A0A9Q8WNC3_9PEZI|nr:uncharacterized protein CLUP02_15225 [Colletotrichum lupini]UQC89694.1 hypothetical protein CLUP02_15225 [Colletotrichum lupini]